MSDGAHVDLRIQYENDVYGNRVKHWLRGNGDGYEWDAVAEAADTVYAASTAEIANPATDALGSVNGTYWRPSGTSTTETIELDFASEVNADGVKVYQSTFYNYVTKIELFDGTSYHEIWTGVACDEMSGPIFVSFAKTLYTTNRVRVTVDASWFEEAEIPAINAVELIHHEMSEVAVANPVVTAYTIDGWNPAKGPAIGLENFDVWSEDDGVWSADYGSSLTTYLRGDRVDELLGRSITVDMTTDRAWFLTDKLGSINTIIDITGSVLDKIDYDAYGNIISETHPENRGSYGYTAREFDPLTGLQDNRDRQYMPSMGRFLQKDPSRFWPGESNLTFYVHNNPTNWTDPSGMSRFERDMGLPDWRANARADIEGIQRPPTMAGSLRVYGSDGNQTAAGAMVEAGGLIVRMNGEALVQMAAPAVAGAFVRVGVRVGSRVVAAALPRIARASSAMMRITRPACPMVANAGAQRITRVAPSIGGSAQTFNSAGQIPRTGSRPVIAQTANNTCGPTCADMVLNSLNPNRTSTNIVPLNLGPNGAGIDRIAALLRANGINASWTWSPFSISDLARATARGKPVIVAVRLPNGGGGHFVIVDEVRRYMRQRVVAVRDPAGGRQYFELANVFWARMTGQRIVIH